MNTPTDLCPRKTKRSCRSWERRKEHRPSELLDAAAEVFVARGYAAARLDDVAARAGVSKGTLYLYYSGKEELFKAVVRLKFKPLMEEFRARVEHATGGSVELLTEVISDWWCCFSQPHVAGLIKLIVSEAGNFPEIARFFHDEVASVGHETIRRLLHRGVERNEFRSLVDLDTATHLVMAPMVMQLIWIHSVGAHVDDNFDPDEFLRHHTALVLMTLSHPDSSAASAGAPAAPVATAHPSDVRDLMPDA